MKLRELCNVSFATQAESKSEQADYERWLVMLNQPPRSVGSGRPVRAQSFIDTKLDNLMPDLPPQAAA